MPTVIGAQFKPVTKIYFFDPEQHLDLAPNDYVIVDTVKGRDLVQIVQAPHNVPDDEIVGDIKRVVRRATPWDLLQKELWKEKQTEAVSVCREKARTHGLDIKVLRCEYNYEGGRLTVFFASEQRVDFRALVRDLARTFHTRIEMRQIGVRDEAALLGGVGRCGRELCCSTWLPALRPVSLQLAKDQRLSLNPSQISGCCGRLMCCLKYEHDAYVQARRRFPREGRSVKTRQGREKVVAVDIWSETVTLLADGGARRKVTLKELKQEVARVPRGKRSR
jgi:cell fate regulator YaaT (PSP1 superfamily)